MKLSKIQRLIYIKNRRKSGFKHLKTRGKWKNMRSQRLKLIAVDIVVHFFWLKKVTGSTVTCVEDCDVIIINYLYKIFFTDDYS